MELGTLVQLNTKKNGLAWNYRPNPSKHNTKKTKVINFSMEAAWKIEHWAIQDEIVFIKTVASPQINLTHSDVWLVKFELSPLHLRCQIEKEFSLSQKKPYETNKKIY